MNDDDKLVVESPVHVSLTLQFAVRSHWLCHDWSSARCQFL